MHITIVFQVAFAACAALCKAVELPSEDTNADVEKLRHSQYCVVGAGPGGLQMAYMLQQAGRDYVVYEKGSGAGTFYTKFPIHRNLISINKRNTGSTNKQFNWRHDWNSILSHDESLQMTKYSKEFFPPADVLVDYLNDYRTKLGLNIQFNTEISNIMKRNNTVFQMNDQNGNTFTCQYVIVATGIATSKWPKNVKGFEFVTDYSNLTTNLDEFEGKSVLILGRGNSGHETAQHIMSATNYVHMYGRSATRLAWATHYVGDLRAVNNGILDTYQLKSLDGLVEGPLEHTVITRDEKNGKLYIDAAGESGVEQTDEIQSDDKGSTSGYDIIITCLGFRFDASIFHHSLQIKTTAEIGSGKYPTITSQYGQQNVSGLYFAGTNTHSLDWRRSAGGFIHGFRYTTIALHRFMEWKHHGQAWPSVRFDSLIDLIPHILKRLNEAPDIYQMFSVLCDVVIHSVDLQSATYLEAYPCAAVRHLPKLSGHSVPGAVTVVSMEYGKNFSGAGKDPFYAGRAVGGATRAHLSNFLHPVLYHYNKLFKVTKYFTRPAKWVFPVPDRMLHLVEDFYTKFASPTTHLMQLRRFFEDISSCDLRNFFAAQCFQLAMTWQMLPEACRVRADPASHPISATPHLQKSFYKMGLSVLPLTHVGYM